MTNIGETWQTLYKQIMYLTSLIRMSMFYKEI